LQEDITFIYKLWKGGKIIMPVIALPVLTLWMGIVSLIFGIIVMIFPKILNYLIGIYLIVIGIMALIAYFKG
jgi:uncharacterized membrane protein HdeD (DUF308 family)